MTTTTETRIFVKILFSENGYASLADVRYYRNEMKPDFFVRWRWYFEYRAALLRVKHPKSFIKIESGPYEYVLPEAEYRAKVRNAYLSNKRQYTKALNLLNSIRQNWSELFPIEDNPEWSKVQRKLMYYKLRLEESEKEYNKLFKNG